MGWRAQSGRRVFCPTARVATLCDSYRQVDDQVMIAARSQWKLPPSFSNQRASARSVPRVFQIVLIVYVLLTGELVRGAQAALFGLQGGGDAAFTAAVLLAIALDIARIGPVFLYARHPLGILHPLILTTVLWPLLVAMPRT